MFWFSDDLPFEFKALELVLELSCLSLDAQVCHHLPLTSFCKDSCCNYKKFMVDLILNR